MGRYESRNVANELRSLYRFCWHAGQISLAVSMSVSATVMIARNDWENDSVNDRFARWTQ
jgi:hypothetical protein